MNRYFWITSLFGLLLLGGLGNGARAHRAAAPPRQADQSIRLTDPQPGTATATPPATNTPTSPPPPLLTATDTPPSSYRNSPTLSDSGLRLEYCPQRPLW